MPVELQKSGSTRGMPLVGHATRLVFVTFFTLLPCIVGTHSWTLGQRMTPLRGMVMEFEAGRKLRLPIYFGGYLHRHQTSTFGPQ